MPQINGRDGGIWTHDLQHPMLARYQATLHPEYFCLGMTKILIIIDTFLLLEFKSIIGIQKKTGLWKYLKELLLF